MATYKIKMLKDEDGIPFIPLVSTQGIQDPSGETLDDKLQNKLETSNIIQGDNITIIKNGNDCTINAVLPPSGTLINNLTTSLPGQGALDAYQGKILKDSIPQVIDDLTSTSSIDALSANQGYILNTKFNNYITKTSIVNNLLSTDSSKVLSAAQGKILNDTFNDYIKIESLDELVNNIILSKYPIGSIEINVSGINPEEYIGGVWESFGTGRTIVGIDVSQSEFKTAEKIGGEKSHVLNTDELPSHSHYGIYGSNSGYERKAGWGTVTNHTGIINEMGEADWESLYTGNSGGDQPHNNLQPYIVVYMWKRIS